MHDDKAGQMTGKLSPLLELVRNRMVATLVPEGADLLDLGCGRAALYKALLKKGRKVRYTGVDRLPACIEHNRTAMPECSFLVSDISDVSTSLLGRTFDTIALVAVLEHLDTPEPIFVNIHELLRPGGRVLITTPRRNTEGLLKWGAWLGWCSSEALEEHQSEMPDKASLLGLADRTGFELSLHRHFLLGMVQLAVFTKQ